MQGLGWIVAGTVSIAVGLTIWFTAFVLVPLGMIFVLVGIVTTVKKARSEPADAKGDPTI